MGFVVPRFQVDQHKGYAMGHDCLDFGFPLCTVARYDHVVAHDAEWKADDVVNGKSVNIQRHG
ncbi:hypothetical protein DL347_28600 [Pseudomonas fluorescens]|uniref:Uncharacterized protein n=1 Tax=Pseudomonas fluorescens TaxID=294 RepID=A0A7Z6MRQ9_PSEFL|nr:hypothetical protein DL347_28600 [Pseudomonas fluorescens]